jgi:dipeptide/tripeptide permease
MDTAPRSAFLAGVVQPHERTAMMGFIYITRSSASSVGPIITGVLAGKGNLWVAFVTAGSLMVVYDMGILVAFGGHKSQCQDEESDDQIQNEERNDSVMSVKTAEAIGAVGEEEKSES